MSFGTGNQQNKQHPHQNNPFKTHAHPYVVTNQVNTNSFKIKKQELVLNAAMYSLK